jgi:hypothetical protein
MVSAEIRRVVGIDVATTAHVVCALDVPSGSVRLKSTSIPATAAGHARLLEWLGEWGAGELATLLIGMESTGSLWEPLDDALTQAGYSVVLRESPPNRLVGHEFGLAGEDRWHRRPHLGPRLVGGLGAGEHGSGRDGAGAAHADPHAPRLGRESECGAEAGCMTSW